MPATVPGRAPGQRRSVQPMTLLGIALVAILICIDAAIWFSRGDDEAAASQGRQRVGASEQSAARAPGDYVSSKVKGDRLVTEHQIVTEESVSSVVLSIRETKGYDDVDAAVSRLQLSADGRDVQVDMPPLSRGTVNTIELPNPASAVELRYVTGGVVIPSVPTTTGRALVVANPVVAEVEAPAGRSVVELDATKVLSMACDPGRGVAEPCGRPDKKDGWRIKLSRAVADSTIVAQVDTESG